MWPWWFVHLQPQRSGVQWLSSGPNSTSNSNFWVIKGGVVKFIRICSWPVSKVMLINCVMHIKMCLITHQIVRQFSVNIPWNWRQNCKRTSLSQTIKACTVPNLYRWRFWSLCRMHRTLLSDMPIAWASIHAERLGLRLMHANTWVMFSGVWTKDSQPGGFYTQQTFIMPWPYPLTDCILRWDFQLIQFMAKSGPSLCNGPHSNKESHGMHMFSNSPVLHVD
jgi:hypothetical protein